VRSALVAAALAAVMSIVFAVSAFADGENTANVTIRGGNAKALAACVNVAKGEAEAKKNKKKHQKQVNRCKNWAAAYGGDVDLRNVSIRVRQRDKDSAYNNANVTIAGGDATAVAACLNVAQDTATTEQVNVCANTAIAVGGDVTLRNVRISIRQS
jgi:hypothetical protein